MMAFTGDGQVRPELVEERDRRYGISTAGERPALPCAGECSALWLPTRPAGDGSAAASWEAQQRWPNVVALSCSLPAAVPTAVLLLCCCCAPAAEKGRERRELLEWPEGTDPAADHWQSGTAWQTAMEQLPFKHIEPPGSASSASASEAGPASGSAAQ